MKPEIKEKWLQALRSGDYKQSVGFLKTDAGYCCLGVLCELYAKEHDTGSFQAMNVSTTYSANIHIHKFVVGENTESQFLPYIVADWAGLSEVNPFMQDVVSGDKEWYRVSQYNDEYRYTFAEIANIIEASE